MTPGRPEWHRGHAWKVEPLRPPRGCVRRRPDAPRPIPMRRFRCLTCGAVTPWTDEPTRALLEKQAPCSAPEPRPKPSKLDVIDARVKAATPGPWFLAPAIDGSLWIETEHGGGLPIAKVCGSPVDRELLVNAPQDLALLATLVRSVADAECDGHPEARPAGHPCAFRWLPGGAPFPSEQWCHPCRLKRALETP